jgi:hypothetical protein
MEILFIIAKTTQNTSCPIPKNYKQVLGGKLLISLNIEKHAT